MLTSALSQNSGALSGSAFLPDVRRGGYAPPYACLLPVGYPLGAAFGPLNRGQSANQGHSPAVGLAVDCGA
jgi:hypothetical protein